jgi:hypothetical protein
VSRLAWQALPAFGELSSRVGRGLGVRGELAHVAAEALTPKARNRLVRLAAVTSVKQLHSALRREIDACAEAHGVSRSRAAGHFLAIAREAIHERAGVPGSRAEELLEAVDGLRTTVDILASGVLLGRPEPSS